MQKKILVLVHYLAGLQEEHNARVYSHKLYFYSISRCRMIESLFNLESLFDDYMV